MIALWKGHVSLPRAFWRYGVLYAALANLGATAAALGALAAELPPALAVGIFLLPAPYIFVAVVGVWRSADAYSGPRHWATLARVIAVLWGALMVLV